MCLYMVPWQHCSAQFDMMQGALFGAGDLLIRSGSSIVSCSPTHGWRREFSSRLANLHSIWHKIMTDVLVRPEC